MTGQQRFLTLDLIPLTGEIIRFYVFVNGERVIDAPGTSAQQWSGEIPAGEIRIKFRVTGIDAAQYKVKIDLPVNIHDQEIVFTLDGGYHEWEMRI
jgi:hypothetical protein